MGRFQEYEILVKFQKSYTLVALELERYSTGK